MSQNSRQRRRTKRGDRQNAPSSPGHGSKVLVDRTGFQALLENAMWHHRRGKLVEAEGVYQQVLGIDPYQPDAIHLLGLLKKQQGRLNESIELLDRAVSLNPQVPAFQNSRGITLVAMDQYEDAILAYETAIDIDPLGYDSHYNRGLALRDLGRTQEAVLAFAKVVELNPDFTPGLNNLGLTLHDMGKVAKSLEAFDKALSIDPVSAETHNNRGLALQDMGRFKEALAAFEQAISHWPKFSVAHYNRGEVLDELELLEDALKAFEKSLQLDPDFAEAHCSRGVVLLKLGQLDKALGSFNHCLDIVPGHVCTLPYKAVTLYALSRHEEAGTLVDLDNFPVKTSLAIPDGYVGLDDFLSPLRDHVLEHPSLVWEPFGKTTRMGSQTAQLGVETDTVFADFVGVLKLEIDRFLSSLTELDGHPYFFQIPQTYRLSVWATVLQNGGHQLPHIHPNGWLSGIYYIQVPKDIYVQDCHKAGWLEIGRPSDDIPLNGKLPQTTVKPEPGLLLLFPSYYFHRTVPFKGCEQRISIAFDVEPISYRN